MMSLTDPILRSPALGSMLMGMGAALVGVIAFVRRRCLLGESLSHASYPGVVIALALGASFSPLVLLGACIAAALGLLTIEWLEKTWKVKQDAALCLVLATFFGVGLTIASRLQWVDPVAFRRTEIYLYGQAATMTSLHLWIYGGLDVAIVAVIYFCYRSILMSSFDRSFARSIGIPLKFVEGLVFALIVLAVVTGIRSAGVVLMSAMLIAPPIAARQFTHKLSVMFLLSAFFGAFSGLLGIYLSVWLSEALDLSFPTGPMIVLVASAIALLSLTLAPQRGIAWRLIRMWSFRQTCATEHVLKALWHGEKTFDELYRHQALMRFHLWWILRQLTFRKLVTGHYRLTKAGERKGARIVRLHRLWELYLVDYLGASADRVHRNAEEMEHILTPEIEKELMQMLKDPKLDPHHQPIPLEGV